MNSYNMTHTVCFPTRIYNNLGAATDKIFINNIRFNYLLSQVKSMDYQIMMPISYLKNVFPKKMVTCLTYRTREISKDSVSYFQEPL